MSNEDFVQSSISFKAMLKKLKAEGKANVKHHSSISQNDMDLIRDSLRNKMLMARGLQQKYM